MIAPVLLKYFFKGSKDQWNRLNVKIPQQTKVIFNTNESLPNNGGTSIMKFKLLKETILYEGTDYVKTAKERLATSPSLPKYRILENKIMQIYLLMN